MMFTLTHIGIAVVCHCYCTVCPGSLSDLFVCVLVIVVILSKWSVVWSQYWCGIQTIWIMLQVGTINLFVCSDFRFSLMYSNTHCCGFPISLQYNLFFFLQHVMIVYLSPVCCFCQYPHWKLGIVRFSILFFRFLVSV